MCHVQVTDMRTQKEMGTYRGHNRDVTCASWHPLHEELFASGGYDGSLLYWLVSSPNPQVLGGSVSSLGSGQRCYLALITCKQMCTEVRVEVGVCLSSRGEVCL